MLKLIITIIVFCGIIFHCSADVILFSNGSTQDVIVKEITTDEIKYTKSSRANGPLYTVPKSDVISISYEDGTIDEFNPNIASNNLANISTAVAPLNLNEINKYEADISYLGKETNKEARACYGLCRFNENSILYDGNIRMEYICGSYISPASIDPSWHETDSKKPYVFFSAIKIKLSNLSPKTIYIDLANTFFKRGSLASPYFIPSSSTNISSETSGIGVNLGGITSALGIGGSIGSLASGITVGTSSTSGNSTTIYSQRIVSIPPQSSIELKPQLLFPPYLMPGAYKVETKHYSYNFDVWQLVGLNRQNLSINIGETKDYSSETSPISFGVYLSYSFNEQLSETRCMNNTAYLSRLIGLENFKPAAHARQQTKNADKLTQHFGEPLHFFVFIH